VKEDDCSLELVAVSEIFFSGVIPTKKKTCEYFFRQPYLIGMCQTRMEASMFNKRVNYISL